VVRFPLAKTPRAEATAVFWLRSLRRLGVYRRFVVAVTSDPRIDRESRLAVACERLGPEGLEEYLAFRSERGRGVIRRRFEAGEICFVGRSDGRIVTATWSSPGRARLEFLACEILLDDGGYYNHDTYVIPELRGMRVAGAVAEFRRRFMREAGYEWALGLFETENRVATRRSKRRKNVVIGRLDCLRLGPWRRLQLRLDSGVAESRWYRAQHRRPATLSLPFQPGRPRPPG